MELQEIEVVIDPDGITRIEVCGVSGPSCLALTEDLEEALGGEVVSRKLSAEAQAVQRTDVDEPLRRRG